MGAVDQEHAGVRAPGLETGGELAGVLRLADPGVLGRGDHPVAGRGRQLVDGVDRVAVEGDVAAERLADDPRASGDVVHLGEVDGRLHAVPAGWDETGVGHRVERDGAAHRPRDVELDRQVARLLLGPGDQVDGVVGGRLVAPRVGVEVGGGDDPARADQGLQPRLVHAVVDAAVLAVEVDDDALGVLRRRHREPDVLGLDPAVDHRAGGCLGGGRRGREDEQDGDQRGQRAEPEDAAEHRVRAHPSKQLGHRRSSSIAMTDGSLGPHGTMFTQRPSRRSKSRSGR